MTERSESERVELVAELKEFLDRSCINDNAMTFLRKVETALRSLAAQDQKPVAWVIPTGDNVRDNGFIDCMAWEEGEFTKPLYPKPFPPPAAGWDEAIEACQKIAENPPKPKGRGHACIATGRDIADAIEALRHNAPPVSGVKLIDPIDSRGLKGARKQAAENCASMLPDHGGADAGVETFQSRVQSWMMACFGPEISADRIERNHRFLEEALELVQSNGCTQSEAHQLVDYVYGRPQGEINQEVGGVMVTLAALCLANGIDMHEGGETELARVWTKVEKIRAKQAAKPKHSPLPGPSAPAPVDANASAEARLREALTGLQRQSNAAYCRYIDQMSKPECLGFEAKFLSGKFSKIELDAHARAGEMIGAHRALSDAVKQINEALSAHPHASAEARLREALSKYLDEQIAETSKLQRNAYAGGNDRKGEKYHAVHCALYEVKMEFEALSKHPHASDRDKTTYDVLGDQRTCVGVPASGIAKMMDAVENPKQPNEALKKLMRGHASDCDKQGPVPSGYGEYTPITVGGSTSNRTADVTGKISIQDALNVSLAELRKRP